MWAESICTTDLSFEQPLSESFRLCLRLEYLFNQLDTHVSRAMPTASHTAISALVKILGVADRSDMKTKLGQLLGQNTQTLEKLVNNPNVSLEKLREMLNQLDTLTQRLKQPNEHHFGDALRQNSFISLMRQQLTTPNGICPYSTPAYALWLSSPCEKRVDSLRLWSSELDDLRQVVQLITSLTRSNGRAQRILCENNFYYQSLDNTINYELIRVVLPVELQLYPEFSVSKHRVNVRFIPARYDNHRSHDADKNPEPFEFELICCHP